MTIPIWYWFAAAFFWPLIGYVFAFGQRNWLMPQFVAATVLAGILALFWPVVVPTYFVALYIRYMVEKTLQ